MSRLRKRKLKKFLTLDSGYLPSSAVNFASSRSLPSWMTHSRAGNAMMWDSTGKLTFAPNNLITASDDFSSGSWTKAPTGVALTTIVTANAGLAPDGTMTADRAEMSLNGGTTSGDAARLYRGQSFGPGNLISSIWIKSYDGVSTYNASLITPNAGRQQIVITGSWQRFEAASPDSSGNGYIGLFLEGAKTPANSNTADILVSGARLSRVTYETSLRPGDDVVTTTAAFYGPRFDYDSRTHVPGSLLLEAEARTNYALWNNDFTNAAWTKTNVTAAKNQTGPDGVANSASSLTATAGGGTTSQAIVLANGVRFLSCYAKRITGTGSVEMTMDGGLSFIPVTIPASWGLISIPTQTLTNPNIGFRILTNGDAIAVAECQLENGAYGTSPIRTTTAAVARAAEDVRIVDGPANVLAPNLHTVALEAKIIGPVSASPVMLSRSNGSADLYVSSSAGKTASFDAASTPSTVASNPAGTLWADGTRGISSVDSSGRKVTGKGSGVASASGVYLTAYSGSRLGAYINGTQQAAGWYSSIAIWPSALPSGVMQEKANRSIGGGWS